MIVETTQAYVALAPGQISRLQLRAGTRLRGVSGAAWITIDDDARDIVLEHNEEWLLDRDGRVVVSALRPDRGAEVHVEEPLRPGSQRQPVAVAA